ncbi:flagellar protein FlbD [candidate division KSB1 bacterium]|nr:MAG: flagellar protein FlbD [candidate division KSB1 bacterium 4484_219]RKY77153.1 MAG: flagellar protein FlbD [candidate division KSB1 bacterium]RKY85701.1 MAG: flagellar protein FlbD [candidate division KSB1 bacterium]RKY87034.1 MAG: flagellar protein FlbD [candidate division KSB1 bacterium]RKY92732.1 MAG: flagellar protein FlbD [candidate division KSB1 bacterium]
MIKVTTLNGKELVINAELIETVEQTPDTIITLTTNKKLIVLEDADDIIDKVIEYKQKIFSSPENSTPLNPTLF